MHHYAHRHIDDDVFSGADVHAHRYPDACATDAHADTNAYPDADCSCIPDTVSYSNTWPIANAGPVNCDGDSKRYTHRNSHADGRSNAAPPR